MFRRFVDRANDAVFSASTKNSTSSSNNNENSDARVLGLAAMGFREAEAMHALRVTKGDMTRATEWLLQHGTPVGAAAIPTTPAATMTSTAMDLTASDTNEDDREFHPAIQASLITGGNNTNNSRRRTPPPSSSPVAKQRSATLRTTGDGTGLASTHPKVRIPKRLWQHDREDVILRCADRVAPRSLTVDTLLRSMKTIQADPQNRNYHTVDTTTATFRRSLTAPGVLDFLRALNFFPRDYRRGLLALVRYDPAAFYLGISALERVQRESPEYARDKVLRSFRRELRSCLDSRGGGEAAARSRFLSTLPSEPKSGGSRITVEFGVAAKDSNNYFDGGGNAGNAVDGERVRPAKISRGFDHDDTLGDVVNWLGGAACSVIPSKLAKGEWRLVDVNEIGAPEDYGYRRIDVPSLLDETLQRVGCFPSGRLAVVPMLLV